MSSLLVPDVEAVRAMSPAQLEALARELDGVRREAESALATLVHRVEETGAYRRDGHRGVRAWGMAACNWSLPESARFVKAGHLLARFPSASGMGVAQLQALAAVAANPRVSPHLDEAEGLLVGQAAVLDFSDYACLLRAWEAAADPDGAHADHERAHREREATLSQVGAKAYFNAQGGAVAGAQLKEVFEAFVHTEFLADWEAGVAIHGEAMSVALMARTERQRRFDAMMAVFAAAAGSGVLANFEPIVNVLVDQATFEHALVKALGGSPEPLDPSVAHRCETADGVQLDPIDVLVAAAVGHVRRVVLDSAGVVVDLGRKQRLFTGPLRDILLALARHCFGPGCHHPPRQVDHVLPFSIAGPTAAWNGGPACGHHNRWRATHGYTVVRDQHGHWHHYRPDGTEVGWRAAVPMAGA
ncbi:MAG: HNH endonuclease signature motif containing protein [Actinomycetota bacterium]|nr:HNH endonuclease signature motif containing protein [Actinomycetota bacterium]